MLILCSYINTLSYPYTAGITDDDNNGDDNDDDDDDFEPGIIGIII